MNILNKIRSLPEKKKKIIFWIVMSIITIFFFSFYVLDVQKTLKENKGKEIIIDQSYFQKIDEEVNKAKEMIFGNINKDKE